MKILLFAATILISILSFAQAPGDGRGSMPPGTSADGSRPADGAIKGGSIVPGERAGMPDGPQYGQRAKRCDELGGTLREQCLLDEQSASTGASRQRGAEATKSAPPDAPPPQNPR